MSFFLAHCKEILRCPDMAVLPDELWLRILAAERPLIWLRQRLCRVDKRFYSLLKDNQLYKSYYPDAELASLQPGELHERYTLTARSEREQQAALDAIVRCRKNVFVTGSAGTGKSHILKEAVERLKCKQLRVAVTATSGIAGFQIGGRTLHHFVGLGLAKESIKTLIESMKRRPALQKRWLETDVLVVDEVSMVEPDFFEKVDALARSARCCAHKPFGGMQVVFFGDFFQLMAILERGAARDPYAPRFCFQCPAWDACVDEVHYLRISRRQTDKAFFETLEHVRSAVHTEADIALLRSRVGAELGESIRELGIVPTRLFSHRNNADEVNKQELAKLGPGGKYRFTGEGNFSNRSGNYPTRDLPTMNKACDDFLKSLPVERDLVLKRGAQVLLVVNMDPDEGLVNGSRGVVTNFEVVEGGSPKGEPIAAPIVTFANGKVRRIEYHCWDRETHVRGKSMIMRYEQLPLVLAWALTIHKCITGDTLVHTTGSGLRRIEDLVPSSSMNAGVTAEVAIGVVGAKKEAKLATQIYKGHVEDGLEITTRLGYTLRGSMRHPIRVWDGAKDAWKRLRDLTAGDVVLLQIGAPSSAPSETSTESFTYAPADARVKIYSIPGRVDAELGYLFGVLVGDGWYASREEFRLTTADMDVGKEFDRITSSKFGKSCAAPQVRQGPNMPTYTYIYTSQHIRAFLTWCGLKEGAVAICKSVPWTVLQNTQEVQRAFLRGLFDTDGGVNSNVHFTTVSRELGIQVQILLAAFDIICNRSVLHEADAERGWSKAYRITISGNYARKFAAKVGFFCGHKRAALARAYGEAKTNVPKYQIGYIPNGQQIISDLRRQMATGNTRARIPNGVAPRSTLQLLGGIARGTNSKLTLGHIDYLTQAIPTLGRYASGRVLLDLKNRGALYDTVESIAPIHAQMYDLCVPNQDSTARSSMLDDDDDDDDDEDDNQDEDEDQDEDLIEEGHEFVTQCFISHNSQGMSLDAAEIDLGSNVFAEGQAYVALSRVRSLNGLKLIHFEPGSIKASAIARAYYLRAESNQQEQEQEQQQQQQEVRYPTEAEIKSLAAAYSPPASRHDTADDLGERQQKRARTATVYQEK